MEGRNTRLAFTNDALGTECDSLSVETSNSDGPDDDVTPSVNCLYSKEQLHNKKILLAQLVRGPAELGMHKVAHKCVVR